MNKIINMIIRSSVFRSFFNGQLSPTQTHEIQNEILALGVSL
jgi:hypothetical protein